MVDERGRKCKWWKKGGKRKYEIVTGLFSWREHHILGPWYPYLKI
jgi:hypothetical protein